MNLSSKLTTPDMVSIEINDSLSGLVKSKLENTVEIKRPKDYFYITELVNPQQAYWDRKDRLEPETDIRERLIKGTKLHRIAGYWFKDIEGFDYYEAILDGVWVGIEGVRGKIDFRYGDSIVEIKSKPDHVKDAESVISKYPHDLEQLLFYASISTIKSDLHYLVFIHDEKPHPISVFRIRIKEIEKIKKLLIKRIDMLRGALLSGDPKGLGRCRYFTKCQYLKNKKCDCKNIDPLDTSLLRKYVEIKRDKKMESKLSEKRKEVEFRFSGTLNPYQLLFPRKWYKEEVLGLKGTFKKSVSDEERESMLWKAINDCEKIKVIPSDKKEVCDKKIPIIFPSNYVKYLESGRDSTTAPYLYKVSKETDKRRAQRPHNIPLSQLAIICGVTNSKKGLIFVMYPNLENRITAYVATFKNLDLINDLIDYQIELIKKVLENEDPSCLPLCESFMRASCGKGCLCQK